MMLETLSSKEDADWVESYRGGDEHAFTLILQKHLPSIYAFVFQMVRDQAVAEDIAQESFVKAWRHLGRYDASKPLRTWLFAIAKNGAYDWLKKKKAIPFSAFTTEENDDPFVHVADDAPLPDEFVMRSDAKAALDRIISQLPERYRALIVLVYQEDFSLQEAAEILGEPYNTVKSRHQRALAKLRALLPPGAPEAVL